jgi:hypothetical protein
MSEGYYRSDRNEDLYAPYQNNQYEYSSVDGYNRGDGEHRGGGRGGFAGGGRSFNANKRGYDDYGGGGSQGGGSFNEGRGKRGRFEEVS